MSLDEMLDLKPKKKKKKIGVSIDPDLLEEARAIAKAEGIKISQLVEGLVRVWVDSKKSLIKE